MYTHTLCLIRRGNELLLLNRHKAPWMGSWLGAGGRIEPDETPLQGALREIREETGISLETARYAGSVTWEVAGKAPGGMEAFVAEVPADFDYPTPRATREGILDWKAIEWVVDPKNTGVAHHLRAFLPAMLESDELADHHFIWDEAGAMRYERRAFIRFRPMTPADFPLMHAWFQDPLIREIWNDGEEKSLTDVAAKYTAYIEGVKPTRPFMILFGGKPVGYIQTYLWRDWAQYLEPEEESCSLDVFIGEAADRGRGLGSLMLRTFLRDYCFADPQVESCVITPDVRNVAAHRAYEKAGFSHWKTVELPDEPGPTYLMRITRDEAV